MDKSTELISIIMPLYNSSKYLESTLDSVIAQTYINWQLIIVDDFSSDNSYDIAKKYADSDIRIVLKKLKNKSNFGALEVRNECMKYATGRYIAFLDSDDLWEPIFLEHQIKFLKEKNTGFVCSGFYRMTGNDKDFILPPQIITYKSMLKSNPIGCLTAFYDTKIIGGIVKMPQNSYRREDFACFLQIIKKNGGIAYGNQEVLATYRIHDNSASSGKIKMAKYQFQVYRKVEKINFFKSLYYVFCWALLGLKKYKNLKK